MSTEQRACPYCGTSLAADQRTCPNPSCGLPYPFDDEPSPLPQAAGSTAAPGRPGRPAGGDNPLAPFKTVIILVGVLVVIVGVGYLLFRFGVSYLESGRPDPAAAATSTAGPVVVPPALSASPGAGAPGAPASPSPVTQPGAIVGASPSPSPATGPRLKVANTDGQGANMRQRPSTTAPVLRTLPEGAVVEAIGGETNADGRAWRNVRDQGGATGYVAAELLVPE